MCPGQRPDFSNYVAHFTKDASPFGAALNPNDPAFELTTGLACERLVSILEGRRLIATPMPWTGRRAVAFTECPWWSMVDHARQYSAYGVGFTKAHLFAAGGGPAVYMRQDLFARQQEYVKACDDTLQGFCPDLYAFVTPFAPGYAPRAHLDNYWSDHNPLDYTHEREWRVPHDFRFEL